MTLPLLILLAVVWFGALGFRPLVKTDEGRYAEMAREIVATGDWITPRLNGLKYFEKPPLQNWVTAATFQIFGLGDWQARLWTGLTGFFGIVLTAYAGRRIYNRRTGLYAGAVLASCFWWSALGHINTLDMGLSGMMSLALCSLLIAQHNRNNKSLRGFWMGLCWAGMALAVLSKGLIGIVLPGAVMVLYLFWSRDWILLKSLNWLSGLLIFFAITVPWFVAVSIANPEFPQFFFIHEHFQRFLTKVHHREGPWWYFFPLLIAGLIPWLGWLPTIFTVPLREPSHDFQAGKLLLVWFAFIFFFFSISSSKLPSYILPVFPALALLIARAMDSFHGTGWFRINGWLTILLSLAGLGTAWQIQRFANDQLHGELLGQFQPWIMMALLVLLITAILHNRWISGREEQRTKALLSMAVGGVALSHLILLGFAPLAAVSSGLSMLPKLQSVIKPETPLYAVNMYDQTMPFYLQRTFTLVKHADEMEFGVQQEPQKWLPDLDSFKTRWLTDVSPIAMMPPATFDTLVQEELPMVVIARDQRRVFVSKP